MKREAVVAALRERARILYRAEIARRVETGGARSLVCNDLVARFPAFASGERALFCTGIVAEVAEIVAELAIDRGPARLPPFEG